MLPEVTPGGEAIYECSACHHAILRDPATTAQPRRRLQTLRRRLGHEASFLALILIDAQGQEWDERRAGIVRALIAVTEACSTNDPSALRKLAA
jgi:hypothetical protein